MHTNVVELNGFAAIAFLLFFLVLLFGVPGFIVYKLVRVTKGTSNKRYLRGKTIVPQYEPPDNLRPGEVGMLYDNKAGRLETLGTLYDLKARKIVAIDETNPQAVRADLLRYNKSELADYEDLLLRALFHESRSVNLVEVARQGEFSFLQAYMSYLYMQALGRKGYADFGPGFESQTYDQYLKGMIQNTSGGNPTQLMHYSMFSGIQKSLTQKAKDTMPQLEGFRQFITTADLDRIRAEMQDKAEAFIERTAPYAVEFNALERWELIHLPLITTMDNSDLKFTFNRPGESSADAATHPALATPADFAQRLDSYIVAA